MPVATSINAAVVGVSGCDVTGRSGIELLLILPL
jgi:hypothetical protein